MSCNQEKYIEEENAIKETWAKDIIDGKYPNISVCFYRGGSEENRYDEEQHILYLTSNDTLNSTFEKTRDAFEWVENNFEDYDFIIRTNLSTYINIEAISQFLKNNESGVDIILTTGLVLNNYNNCIPYPKGHFMIIHKTIVKEIIDKSLIFVETLTQI